MRPFSERNIGFLPEDKIPLQYDVVFSLTFHLTKASHDHFVQILNKSFEFESVEDMISYLQKSSETLKTQITHSLGDKKNYETEEGWPELKKMFLTSTLDMLDFMADHESELEMRYAHFNSIVDTVFENLSAIENLIDDKDKENLNGGLIAKIMVNRALTDEQKKDLLLNINTKCNGLLIGQEASGFAIERSLNFAVDHSNVLPSQRDANSRKAAAMERPITPPQGFLFGDLSEEKAILSTPAQRLDELTRVQEPRAPERQGARPDFPGSTPQSPFAGAARPVQHIGGAYHD